MFLEVELCCVCIEDLVCNTKQFICINLHEFSYILDFIRLFMRSLGEIQNCDQTSSVCQEAYDKTLANYHPWLIKKGAKIAMYTMPTREQLLKKVRKNFFRLHSDSCHSFIRIQ